MPRVRRQPQTLLAALVLALAASLLPTATGTDVAKATTNYEQVVDLTFPFREDVAVRFADDYDNLRGGGRHHQANDMMVSYGRWVHAAMGGTIRMMTGSREGGPPRWGWAIAIDGDDGREYWYLHLGRQDGTWDEAYAEGLREGSRVERGQFLGVAGCSGSATCGSGVHLHFEIHDDAVEDPYDYHDHERINPYPSLKAARARGDFPGSLAPMDPSLAPQPAADDGSEVAEEVVDDGRLWSDVPVAGVHNPAVELLTEQGVVDGCSGTEYCPADPLRRRDMARFLVRELGLPSADVTFDDVPADDPDAGHVAALAAAGVTEGCGVPGRYCPDDVVTRGQMALFLTRALGLAPRQPTFADVAPDGPAAGAIGALVATGITLGCGDGTEFCAGADISRAEIATFLQRSRTVRGVDGPAGGEPPAEDAQADPSVVFLVDGQRFDAADGPVVVAPTTRVAVTAEASDGTALDGSIGSVRFDLDGAEVNTEWMTPWDLFGSGDLDPGEVLPVGDHRLGALVTFEDGSTLSATLSVRVAG